MAMGSDHRDDQSAFSHETTDDSAAIHRRPPPAGMENDPEVRKFLEAQAGQARVTGIVMGFTDMCWEK